MEERQEGDWLSDYMTYVRVFGKVISGGRVEDKDFGEPAEPGKEFDGWKKLAVALGAYHAKAKTPGIATLAGYKKAAARLMQAEEAKRGRRR